MQGDSVVHPVSDLQLFKLHNMSFEITQKSVPSGLCYEVVPDADH